MDYVALVREFHKKFGVAAPDGEVGPLGAAEIKKRFRLMTEETAELVAAMDEGNLIEIADACADLIYVIAGSAVVMGFPTLHHHPTYEDYSRARVPAGENPQKATEEISELQVVHLIHRLVSGLNITLEELRFGDIEKAKRAMRAQIFYVYDVATAYGLPLNECFFEVHRSNMSKTPLNKHGKGGKGEGFFPPDIRGVLLKAREAQKEA